MPAHGDVIDQPQVLAVPEEPDDVLASTRENAVWWGLVGGGTLLLALVLRPVLARRRRASALMLHRPRAPPGRHGRPARRPPGVHRRRLLRQPRSGRLGLGAVHRATPPATRPRSTNQRMEIRAALEAVRPWTGPLLVV